jgi:hypothetical protein
MMQLLGPLQQRLESLHGASGPEQLHAPLPASQVRLQHSAPFVPEEAPHATETTPGCRQQVPSRHETVVS